MLSAEANMVSSCDKLNTEAHVSASEILLQTKPPTEADVVAFQMWAKLAEEHNTVASQTLSQAKLNVKANKEA